MFKKNSLLIFMCASNLCVTISHNRINNSVPILWTIFDIFAVFVLSYIAFKNSEE